MKIAVLLGTRPEIIKMASVIDEINNQKQELLLIHTGQHYDTQMSDSFFEDLKLPTPHYNLHVGSGTHGKQTGQMMEKIEEVLLNEKPDILLVQGDTNAVLAGSLVASKLHIPIGHVEAGLRSYDNTMPEEINRKVADICTQMYFVPTEESAINLIKEGINHNNIYITGNTVVDACFRNKVIAQNRTEYDEALSNINIDNLKHVAVLTMHRAETVDNKERLANIIEAITQITEYNFIFPIHPRTKKNLEKFNLYDKLNNLKHVYITPPLSYLDFLMVTSKSEIILTDSGGLQEEAITLNIPVLTLRYNTERPETVTNGGNILVGTDKENILKYVSKINKDNEFRDNMKKAINPYGDGHASKQIINEIINAFNNNDLIIRSPDAVSNNHETNFKLIDEDITVKEFENKYDVLIKMIINKDTIIYPYEDTKLTNSCVLYEN